MKNELLSGGMFATFGGLVALTVVVWMNPIEATASLPKASEGVYRGVAISVTERHCLVLTAMGEATAGSKTEAVAIMRNILKRKQLKWGGSGICQVVKAKAQYTMWTGRKIPRKTKNPSKNYLKYNGWASIALARGPSQWTHYYHGKTMQKLYGKSRPKWAARMTCSKVGAATMCRG